MSDDDMDAVRDRYGHAARGIQTSGSSGLIDESGSGVYGATQYGSEEALPDEIVAASLGCGNPTAVADLQPRDTVLGLGSGTGIDVLLSAKRVAPTGHAIGLDMTDEMLDLSRENARLAGVTNAGFLRGRIETIPLPGASVDVVISNCVITLSADKFNRTWIAAPPARAQAA